MSDNLTLNATAQATLYLKGDVEKPYTLEEEISLWQVPTKVTKAILGFDTHEERFAAYKAWALLNDALRERITWDNDDPTVDLDFDEEGNQIIVGESVQRSLETVGEAHIRDLDEILARYEGWTFEWSWK
jgi:hypothetical protein